MTDQINFDTMSYLRQDNGVALIALNVKDRSMNVLTPEMHLDFGKVAEHLAGDDKAIGAVIHSAKSSFMAGGDLNRIVKNYELNRTPEEAYELNRNYTKSLRKLETCGKPVAVAMNGTALGGGLELALACHYRVVVDNPKVLLGLPEITLGLLPAGGGTQRLPRLIGIKKAADLILSGRHIHPDEALELGIVDAVVPLENLTETAEKWILDGGSPTQPWDQRGFKIPGGSGLNQMAIGLLFQKLTLQVSVDFKYNYPAPIAILRCLFNGTTVRDMDTALKIETKEFSALTRDPVARNMIRTLFINKSAVERRSKGDALPEASLKKVGLIGAAAYTDLLTAACAKADVELVTQNIDEGVDILIMTGDNHPMSTDSAVPAEKIIGLYLSQDMDEAKAVEIMLYDATSDDTLSHIKTLCRAVRKTPTVQKASHLPLSLLMKKAYDGEGDRLSKLGISATLIENAAIAAGMLTGPALSSQKATLDHSTTTQSLSADDIKNSFLCSQAIIAAKALEEGLVDAVNADLISVLVNRYPSYTGGAISFIDTVGIKAFIHEIDMIFAVDSTHKPSTDWLSMKTKGNDQLYT